MVGSDFVRAVELASRWHGKQKRKATKIPYIAHLLGVASLVLEAGGDEKLAIAAMLHDAIEDQPEFASFDVIREEFGSRVARIVTECTDGRPGMKRDKRNWEARKRAYLGKLDRKASRDARLVSCADKLHNARAILLDLRREGPKLWNRFNVKDPAKQLWYYGRLADVFTRRIHSPKWLPEELERTVLEIAALVGVQSLEVKSRTRSR